MSAGYRAVQWTPFKKRYDLVLLLGVAAYLTAFFLGTGVLVAEPGHPVQVAMRAFGSAAFILLTVILGIGPAARFSDRFKPLLYNRRHLGVATFLLALVHGALVLVWYHGFSGVDPFTSLFTSNPRYDSIQGFPFESLGVLALAILFLMAATSHDFWNANLGPTLWKAIHMGVYVAYGALVAHVLLGVIQFEKSWLYPAMMGASGALLATMHLASGFREARHDRATATMDESWIDAGPVLDIPEKRARIVAAPGGDRIAVFRYDGNVSAIANACRHQNGPLGEGRIIDGCVTCPWHGFQYRPHDGASPPPFTEKVSTFRVRIREGRVWVDPTALPPGTPVEPARISGA